MLAAGLITAAVLAVAAPARAACFYNKSDVPNLGVSMTCGLFCRNDWSIKSGDHACRGGKGGDYWLNGTGTSPKARDSYNLSGMVDDHGYVTVTGSCATGIRLQSWSANHSLRQDRSVNMAIKCN